MTTLLLLILVALLSGFFGAWLQYQADARHMGELEDIARVNRIKANQ